MHTCQLNCFCFNFLNQCLNHFVVILSFQVLSTVFIPKLIGTIFVCLMVYSINLVADKFINRETFRYLGYHNDMVSKLIQ